MVGAIVDRIISTRVVDFSGGAAPASRSGGAAVLWDIDGTLLSAKGAGARCFRDALDEIGHAWPAGPHDFGGRTDLEIGSMLLAAAPDTPVDPVLLASLLAAVERLYEARELDYASAHRRPARRRRAWSTELAAADVVQTVVTGNMASIARRKLHAVALADRLRLDLGAYGDDHADRPELVALALRRVAADRLPAPRSSGRGSSATRPRPRRAPAPSEPAARSWRPGRTPMTSSLPSAPTSSSPT